MCAMKQSPEQIRTMISWPSGPPSRLFKEEGVKPPPLKDGRLTIQEVSARVGGAAFARFTPGDSKSPPGGSSMQNSASSLSGDPGDPRPPTREELIKLLKGCDGNSS